MPDQYNWRVRQRPGHSIRYPQREKTVAEISYADGRGSPKCADQVNLRSLNNVNEELTLTESPN